MRRVPVSDLAVKPSGLDEGVGCLRAVERWKLHRETARADVAWHGDHDAMAVAQRGGDVGLLEGGDQHEGGVGVGKPIPRSCARNDQRSRCEVVHLLAFTEETGADYRQCLVSGGAGDRDDLRWLCKCCDHRGTRVLSACEEERGWQDRMSLAARGFPRPARSPDIARLPCSRG